MDKREVVVELRHMRKWATIKISLPHEPSQWTNAYKFWLTTWKIHPPCQKSFVCILNLGLDLWHCKILARMYRSGLNLLLILFNPNPLLIWASYFQNVLWRCQSSVSGQHSNTVASETRFERDDVSASKRERERCCFGKPTAGAFLIRIFLLK